MIIYCTPWDTWHRWFAWRPVLVRVGDRDALVWLAWVERYMSSNGGCALWDYRLPGSAEAVEK